MSLIFLLSLTPDIDIIIPSIEHRTITHSIIISTIASLPLFTHYKAKATPYFIALIQHSLVGDLITGGTIAGGTQLLWPITSTFYGFPITVFNVTNIIIEWTSFLAAIALMLRTKDLQRLLRGKLSHLSISVPTLTVLLPTLIHFPLAVPLTLLIPHLTYLLLFTVSIINVFRLSNTSKI